MGEILLGSHTNKITVGTGGETETKVSWPRKDGSNSNACALFQVIIGNRMLLNTVATEIKREIEIKRILRIC